MALVLVMKFIRWLRKVQWIPIMQLWANYRLSRPAFFGLLDDDNGWLKFGNWFPKMAVWENLVNQEAYGGLWWASGFGWKICDSTHRTSKNEIEPCVVSDKGLCNWVPTRVACGMIGRVTSLTVVFFSRLLPNKPFAAGFHLSLEAPTHSGIWQCIAEIYISLINCISNLSQFGWYHL